MNLEEYQARYEDLARRFFMEPTKRTPVIHDLFTLNHQKFNDNVRPLVLTRAMEAIWFYEQDTEGTAITDAYNLALVMMGEI